MAVPSLANNTPNPGEIQWGPFTIQYLGVGYQIPQGSTAERWVWWRYNTGGGTTTIEAGPDIPIDLADDDLVLFGNKDGIGLRVQSTSLVDGDLLIEGSVFSKALAAEIIQADHLSSDLAEIRNLAVGEMQGDYGLFGSLAVGAIRLDGAEGLTITHPDGTESGVNSDGSGAVWRGESIVDRQTVLESLDLRGTEMNLSGNLGLTSGVPNPVTPLTVTAGAYSRKTLDTPRVPNEVNGLTINGTGTEWIYAETGQFIGWFSRIMWMPRDDTPNTGYIKFDIEDRWLAFGGVTILNGIVYVLACYTQSDNNPYFPSYFPNYSNWRILRYNEISGAYIGSFSMFDIHVPYTCIGNDGTNLLVASVAADGDLFVRGINPSTGTASIATVEVDTAWGSNPVTSVHRTSEGFGATRWVVSGLTGVRVYTTGGTRVNSEAWPLAQSSSCKGMALDENGWHTFHGSRVYHYTWLSGAHQFGYAWRDNNPSGLGVTETVPKTVTITPPRFAPWRIALPAKPPSDGTVDGADSASIYIAPSGQPLDRKAILTETPWAIAFESFDNSGVTPSVVNGFASRPGNLGVLTSAEVDGSGQPLTRIPGKGTPTMKKFSQAGTATISINNTHTGFVHVTFPVPFDAPPAIDITPSNINFLSSYTARSATGFNAYIRMYTGANVTGSYEVSWEAHAID